MHVRAHTLKYMFVVLWLMSYEMDQANQIQILDKTVYSSHFANTIGKYMNTTFLLPGISEYQGRLRFLTLVTTGRTKVKNFN